MTDKTSPVASHVCGKFGGVTRVAKLLHLTRAAVAKWTYPPSRHKGTGGHIPSRHHAPLLKNAQMLGIDLVAEDFQEHPFGRAGRAAAEHLFKSHEEAAA